MRAETAEALTRSQRPSGGSRTPLLNARFYGWRQHSRVVKVPSTLSGGVNASSWEGLGNPPFSWLPHTSDVLSRWRRLVGISSVIFGSFPSVRGRCVVRGGIRDPPFFWQFVKGAHVTADCLKRVVLLASPACSTRSSPFPWRHSLPPFLLLAGDRTMNGPHHLF